MESGILELHTETVPALSFVSECVAMFAVHARSKGIRVVSAWGAAGAGGDGGGDRGGSVGGGGSGGVPLRPTDVVVLDKFKLSQVLRNLMSNALKCVDRPSAAFACEVACVFACFVDFFLRPTRVGSHLKTGP